MSNYMTDQEQLEQIKDWWRQYGMSIVIGLVIGLLIIISWRHIQYLQMRSLEHASVRYEQLLTYVANGDNTKAMQQADYLVGRYPNSSYAKLATLLLARNAIYQNDLAGADKKLRWVMKTAKVASFRQIARLRLARLLLSEKQADDALQLLSTIDDKTYMPAIAEVQGDIYRYLNKLDEARTAYTEALNLMPELTSTRPLLQMKLDSLAQN